MAQELTEKELSGNQISELSSLHSYRFREFKMPRVPQSQLARTRDEPNEISRTAQGRRQRARMTAEWGLVLDMLTGKKPRRTKDGRNITQVWADMVLADPPGEFARVAEYLLPPEVPDAAAGAGATITNIQALYLTALQAASREPNPRTIEHSQSEADKGANGVQPSVSDW
jgi:hypothetical protein